MRTKILLSAVLTAFLFTTNAQVDPKVSSSPIYKHNKPRVYLEKMLGEVNGVYYVMYSTEPVKVSTLPTLSIKMYDAEDMHLIKTKTLISDNPTLQKKYKDYVLNNYLITKNGLQFFFKEKGKRGMRDIYLGTFDLNLNPVKDFEKVLSYDSDERRFVGLANGNYPNTILATLNYSSSGEKLFIEYKELDKNFDLVKGGKVYLPEQPSAAGGGLFGKDRYAPAGSLSLSDEGKIITSIQIEAEPTKRVNKRGKVKEDKFADQSFVSILVIDPRKEDIVEVPVKLDDDKNIDDFNWYADGNNVLVTGFYSNRNLEKRGNELHGVFYMRVNSATEKMELNKTTKFPEDFLYRINSQNTLIGKRARKKETGKGSINESFQISEVIVNMKTKEITAYCEPIHNYVTTTTDQNGNTSTTYHSDRGSLFYFKVSEDGEFDFFNSIRKKSTWSSSSPSVYYRESVYIHRAPDGKKDYVLYFTERIYNERDKADVKGDRAKWKKTKRDFVIATINNKNGNYELNYPQEYSSKDKTNLGLYVDNITQSNGNLYAYTIKNKMRTSRLITAVVLAVPTVFVAPILIMRMPKSFYERVQLNKIDIKE